MRPRTLDEYVGQQHIVGPGRLLRRAIEADQLSSLIFHGPPGTGKTTLARVIAGSTQARFVSLNAVLAGVKDIRQAVHAARDLRDSHGQRTILFVDEVHRFNKSQQDALLPWVESGTVVLVGATTENPYFEVNKALVSRSRIFQLQPLGEDDISEVVRRALRDAERGFGRRQVHIHDDALAHIVGVANGDARAALNAVELAVETTPADASGVQIIDLSVAEESIQQRAVLYDKEGDAHFDTISAFIKSVRGSDPDAALYWLARMVYAGEDARYIFRRLIILACEDIGLADPHAISVVESCAAAFDRVGLPEGRYHLAHATLYLAATQKSNSSMAFFDALNAVAQERSGDVPTPLKDGTRDKEGFGHGEGYLYPHAYRDHWVAQQYLPDALRGRLFWQPSDQGWEGEVGPTLARRREAQLAAMVENAGLAPVEQLTTGPADPRLDRWLQRTASAASERLASLRDALFDGLAVQRHHLVLDLEPGTGLLTWEALRRVPEGGVWAWAHRPDRAQALQGLAARLPELKRPQVVTGDLPAAVGDVRFDRIVGRDVLVRAPDLAPLLAQLAALLLPGGRLVVVEALARHTQRLSALVPTGALADGVHDAWAAAEEAVYTDPADPLTRHTADTLAQAVTDAGLPATARLVPTRHTLQVTDAVLDRWLAPRSGGYRDRLSAHLDATTLAAIDAAVRRRLGGRAVAWTGASARVEGRLPA
jgi:putative ATPase